MLVLEEQRYIHEDLERLEQGIADRIREDPKHVSFPNLWLQFLVANDVSWCRSATDSIAITKSHSY